MKYSGDDAVFVGVMSRPARALWIEIFTVNNLNATSRAVEAREGLVD